MIIKSSAVKMQSCRSYRSVSTMEGFGKSKFIGRLSQTVLTAAQQNTLREDSGNGNPQKKLLDSEDGLMARFSQSRSIRASRLQSSRTPHYMHTIRRKSIGYMLHQFFWGKNRFQDPIQALLSNNLGSGSILPIHSQAYFEAEKTDFATEGKVVTASGKEITFNVEATMSRTFFQQASSAIKSGTVRLTDPLVINLDSDVSSVSDQKFYFDLDADGHAEQISRLNAGSGFLALDKNGDGIINDGSELFGTSSGNGFLDLAQYDEDGNGWIDEADEIFDKLLIWQKDENGKDVLRALGAAGVGAIYLGNINTEFSMNAQADNKTNAVVRQTGMFLYENGNAGTMQQIDLAR